MLERKFFKTFSSQIYFLFVPSQKNDHFGSNLLCFVAIKSADHLYLPLRRRKEPEVLKRVFKIDKNKCLPGRLGGGGAALLGADIFVFVPASSKTEDVMG